MVRLSTAAVRKRRQWLEAIGKSSETLWKTCRKICISIEASSTCIMYVFARSETPVLFDKRYRALCNRRTKDAVHGNDCEKRSGESLRKLRVYLSVNVIALLLQCPV
ncbi:hypothetical protein ALC56_13333 [Trachymyrmex septentrionalis]|uniref:Uncharacterized protein n=1 Tax=Trachymyrmex septentrionalis TaxID=34720 RepID=A0A195EW31_9HYME|nr:hypothetical protein ALC56_13333 [Trachymyrmex septentrionalis]